MQGIINLVKEFMTKDLLKVINDTYSLKSFETLCDFDDPDTELDFLRKVNDKLQKLMDEISIRESVLLKKSKLCTNCNKLFEIVLKKQCLLNKNENLVTVQACPYCNTMIELGTYTNKENLCSQKQF